MGKGKSLEFSNFDWHHHAYESYTSSGAMTGGMTLKFSNDPLGSFVKTGADPQEDALKAGQRPGTWSLPGETATLALQDTQSPDSVLVAPPAVQPGRYVAYYEGVRDAIRGRAPNPVPAREAAEVMAWLELGAASHAARRELSRPA